MYLSIVSPTTPYMRKCWDYRDKWSWNSASIVGNLTSLYFSYIVDFFHLKIEQLQTHVVCWFNTKTHNMIYSIYCTCIHLNYRYYVTDQNPDIVPRDCWGFSGDLIRKAVPEVENLTEVQGQISYSPHLSLYVQ